MMLSVAFFSGPYHQEDGANKQQKPHVDGRSICVPRSMNTCPLNFIAFSLLLQNTSIAYAPSEKRETSTSAGILSRFWGFPHVQSNPAELTKVYRLHIQSVSYVTHFSFFLLFRASFMTKTVPCGNELHKFLIWDTAGQERVSIGLQNAFIILVSLMYFF